MRHFKLTPTPNDLFWRSVVALNAVFWRTAWSPKPYNFLTLLTAAIFTSSVWRRLSLNQEPIQRAPCWTMSRDTNIHTVFYSYIKEMCSFISMINSWVKLKLVVATFWLIRSSGIVVITMVIITILLPLDGKRLVCRHPCARKTMTWWVRRADCAWGPWWS